MQLIFFILLVSSVNLAPIVLILRKSLLDKVQLIFYLMLLKFYFCFFTKCLTEIVKLDFDEVKMINYYKNCLKITRSFY